MRRFLTFFAVFAVIGCHKFSVRHTEDVSTLNWGFRNEVSGLEPAEIHDEPTANALRQVYETLVTIDEAGQIQPLLADKYSISSDGLTYRFHIREGVRFSDGTPLTEQSALLITQRMRLLTMKATESLDLVKGVEAVHLHGKVVEFVLRKPDSSFLKKLANPACALVKANQGPIRSVQESIGTGPFVIEKADLKQDLILKRNEKYWGGKPGLSEIHISVVIDGATRLQMFKDGRLDITAIQPNDVAAVRNSPELHLTPYNKVMFLQLNGLNAPQLRNRDFRCALAASIDQVEICKTILGDVHLPSTGLLPSVIKQPYKVISNNPSMAKSILPKGAVYSQDIEIAVYAGSGYERLAEAIGVSFEKTLGIKTYVKQYGQSALQQGNLNHTIPILVTGYSGDYTDPSAFLPAMFLSTSGSNGSSYSNPEVDRLIDEGAWDKAMKIVAEDVPIIPLASWREPELVSKRVIGLIYSPYGHLSLAKVNISAK